MFSILLIFPRAVKCAEEYPFYIENKGKEFGIVGEDIRLLDVWNQGITGNGTKIRFILNGCNVEHEVLKNNFISNISFNFNANSTNVSELALKREINSGTALVSICCASKNQKNIYGIAPNASFSVSVASKKDTDISDILYKYYYFKGKDDIIIDTTSFSVFSWKPGIYTKQHVEEVETMLNDVVKNGRNGKGAVLLVSTVKPTTGKNKKLSLFETYPEAFLISRSDYIGGEGPEPYSNPATLCNAPSFGNTDLSYKMMLHPQIYAANGTSMTDGCYTTDQFSHLSIAAGVIALLMEKNPDLTQRDILWIIVLSSTQNDPLHPSWITNGRRLKYSPIYGFGRVNASEAIRLASLWKKIEFEPLKKSVNEYKNISMKIPHARMGKLELNFSVSEEEDSGCVENTVFRFKTNSPDLSMMRIILESPSGTKIELLKPDQEFSDDQAESYYLKEYYQIVARGFLGEQIQGVWKLTIFDSSFYDDIRLTYAGLVFDYMDCIPNFPKQVESSASTSQYPIDTPGQRLSFEIQNETIVCGHKFSGKLTLDGEKPVNTSIFLQDRNTGRTFQVPAILEEPTFEAEIPCIYTDNRKWYISAQNRAENLFKSIQVTIKNPYNMTGFASPVAYENIVSQDKETTQILPSILDNKTILPDNGVGSKYMIALYDINTNKKVLFQSPVFPANPGFLYLKANKPSRGILVAVPIDQETPDPCNTYIVPVIYRRGNEPEVKSFAVPLNDYCPIPKGVITSIPVNTNDSGLSMKSKIIIIVSISAAVLFSCAMAFWICREKRKGKIPYQLDDQILL